MFAVVCCLPAIAFSKPPGSGSVDIWSGATALMMGWLGMFAGNLIPSRGRIPAVIFCAIALALSLTALEIPGTIVDADEGEKQIEPPRAGAYVWMTAMAAQAGAAVRTSRP